MSKGAKKIEVSLDTLCTCYPNLTQEVVIHALRAVDNSLLNSMYLTPVRDKPHCNSLILFTMLLPVPAEACF